MDTIFLLEKTKLLSVYGNRPNYYDMFLSAHKTYEHALQTRKNLIVEALLYGTENFESEFELNEETEFTLSALDIGEQAEDRFELLFQVINLLNPRLVTKINHEFHEENDQYEEKEINSDYDYENISNDIFGEYFEKEYDKRYADITNEFEMLGMIIDQCSEQLFEEKKEEVRKIIEMMIKETEEQWNNLYPISEVDLYS